MEDNRQTGSTDTAALEDLIPGYAHKLNNHLTSVMGYAELLILKTTDLLAKNDLEKIIKQTGQASQIINDLVTISRKRKPQREITNHAAHG